MTTMEEPGDARSDRASFPLQFHIDFLEFLHDRSDRIEVITYADLPWVDDYDYEHDYPSEWRRWKKQLRSKERDPKKIYVILQHDVDDVPERTIRLLREEDRLGLRSTSMIFNSRINQKVLVKEGRVETKPYPLDEEFLLHLQSKGWLIGYHSNAYDQSMHDRDGAMEIFERDVAALRERFNVDFFCPHGGTRDKEGQSNACLELPEALRANLRWVLNRHTPRFDESFSDGAINSWNRDATERDLRDFVGRWLPGKRYRILTHPQYYGVAFRRSRRLAGVPWYEEMVAGYEQPERVNAWRNVVLGDEKRTAVIGTGTGEPQSTEPKLPGRPIFIGGDGRSGTTLLNVILDSHPDLSVGPELHFAGAPNLGPGVLSAIRMIRRNDRRIRGDNLAKHADLRPCVHFVRRVERAGFELDELEALVRRAMSHTGSTLDRFEDRCVLVHELGELMRQRDGKKRFGFKIMKEIKNPPRYVRAWPYAQFVHIIRDGRDVAASQMTEHGSWGYADIEAAARGWVRVIEKARANAVGVPCYEIRYEDLVMHPEQAIRPLLDFLDVKWADAVLRHSEIDHAFFTTTVKHPSRAQTQQPINESAVGRFRADLTAAQISAFESVAGDLLDELGYFDPAARTIAPDRADDLAPHSQPRAFVEADPIRRELVEDGIDRRSSNGVRKLMRRLRRAGRRLNPRS